MPVRTNKAIRASTSLSSLRRRKADAYKAGALADCLVRPKAQLWLQRGDRKHPPFPTLGLVQTETNALLDDVILGMLLSLVVPPSDIGSVTKALLRRFHSYPGVISAPYIDLVKTPKLGRAGAAALKATHAAALRLLQADIRGGRVFGNWKALHGYLHAALARERREQFRVLYLDGKNRLLADELMSRGTVNHVPVFPREIMKRALELHASAIGTWSTTTLVVIPLPRRQTRI